MRFACACMCMRLGRWCRWLQTRRCCTPIQAHTHTYTHTHTHKTSKPGPARASGTPSWLQWSVAHRLEGQESHPPQPQRPPTVCSQSRSSFPAAVVEKYGVSFIIFSNSSKEQPTTIRKTDDGAASVEAHQAGSRSKCGCNCCHHLRQRWPVCV